MSRVESLVRTSFWYGPRADSTHKGPERKKKMTLQGRERQKYKSRGTGMWEMFVGRSVVSL